VFKLGFKETSSAYLEENENKKQQQQQQQQKARL